MNVIQRILKNMGLLLFSQIVAIIFGFFYTIYMARFLGVEGFGIISFAMAFTGIFGVITDFGLNTLTTRDVSRDKCLTLKYLNNIIIIKILLVVITLALTIVSVNVLKYPETTLYVVYLFSISTILMSFVQNFNSIFQAFQKMEYQSLGTIINNVIILGGTLIGITYSFNVIGFSLVYLLANTIVLIFSFVIFKLKFSKFDFPLKNNFDSKFSIKMLKEAFPIFASAFFSIIAFKVDIVILSVIQGDSVVGVYSAAYKLIEILLFLPAIFTITILPIFSKMYVNEKGLNNLKYSYELSVKILLSICLPITILIMVFSNNIILFLYSTSFTNSALTLQLLIWTIPPAFLTYIFGTLLVSINKQKIILKTSVIATIFNILLNLILIPYFSYIGAALVTVFTQMILLILYYISVSEIFYRINFLNTVLKPLIASCVMIMFLYVSLKFDNYLMIIISIISYFIVLFIIKTFNTKDINLFKMLLIK